MKPGHTKFPASAHRPDQDLQALRSAEQFFAAGQADRALPGFRSALNRHPGNVMLLLRTSECLQALARVDEAIELLEKALRGNPGEVPLHIQRASMLEKTGRQGDAEDELRRAIDLDGKSAPAFFALGNLLFSERRYGEAKAAFSRAAELRPSAPEPHYNLGRLHTQEGHLDRAEAEYRKALAIAPESYETRFNLGLLLLSLGLFREGFALFEARKELPAYRQGTKFPFPDWNGEDLAGKSIVICPEQGLGDEIQCLRFVPRLRELGARRITLICSSALKPLFAKAPGMDLVLSLEEAQQGIPLSDFKTQAFSLPHHLKTDLATIPTAIYLNADPARMQSWRPKLSGTEYKIGLVWKGSSSHINDANRSIPSLTEFAPLWSIPGLRFFSLQKGEGEQQAQNPPAGQPITDLGRDIKDFSDTAAIIAQLDLLICADTAVAHLAGALGKACWVLLPATDTDWRWLRNRSDSPWYPSLKLFRQRQAGDWSEPIQLICGALSSAPLSHASNRPGDQPSSQVRDDPQALRGNQGQELPRQTTFSPKATMSSPHRKASAEEALTAYKAGDFPRAQECYELLRRRNPADFNACHMLGVIHAQQQHWQQALPLLRKAVQLNPRSSEALYNLGVAEAQTGSPVKAAQIYERTLALDPEHLDARFNLSCLCIADGSFERARTLLNEILKRRQDYPGAARNLGGVLRHLGLNRDALGAYRQALAVNAESPDLFSDISATLSDLGEAQEAEKWARLALKLSPSLSAALNNLGVARRHQEDDVEAQSSFSAAIESDPDNVSALLNLAAMFVRTDKEIDLAEALIERARNLDPRNPIGLLLEGSLRAAEGRFDDALSLYEQTLPLLNRGNQEEYYPVYLFFLAHSSAISPEATAAAHNSWGDTLFQTAASEEYIAQNFENDRSPDRPLRIGFVSGDLRNHAVLHFAEPTLSGLDKNQFVTIAYSTNRKPDQVSLYAKTLFSGWRDIYDTPDDQLRQQIIADGIDILIDMSGHTNLNRMRLFAMRAAPVQASWIGYPATTGLHNMDYFLADGYFAPRGCEHLFREKLVRLPVVSGFAPFPELPDLVEPPCISKGHFTFGTFNRRLKISPEVVEIWSAILNAIPGSRMIFGAIDRSREADGLRAEFGARGISADRLDFLQRAIVGDYLLRHQQIDLILDAFPYTGGTTSRHALWMGVPTLTSTGRSPVHNQGADLMLSVGLDRFVVSSPEAMIDRAIEIANDVESLRALRLGMRKHLDASELRNTQRLGLNFGKALRAMWRNWSEGKGPIEMEVSND